MNNKTKTILKSVVIILIVLAFVFAMRAPAVGLNAIPSEMKGDYVDSSGLPYFSEMDSYYNLRMTQNYVDHGYFGDKKVNGTAVDTHRASPNGYNVTNGEPGINVVTASLYNIANMFGHHTLKEVAFWAGAIVACFAAIPAYIFTRRITNDYGAIASSLIIALSPNYFSHTFPGFFDTDMFVFIMPLFFILFFIECIKSDNKRHKIIYAILAAITMAIFTQCWSGYVFYLGMIAIFVIIYLILNFYITMSSSESGDSFKDRFKAYFHRSDVLSIILAIIVVIAVLTAVNPDGVLGIFSSVLSGFSLQSATQGSSFPNVFVSVAELQIPSLSSGGIAGAFLANTGAVVNGVGGIICFFAALVVLYTYVHRFLQLRSARTKKQSNKKPPKSIRKSTSKKTEEKRFNLSLRDIGDFGSKDEIIKSRKETLLYLTLFLVWTISAAVACSQGSRFITLLILPFGLLSGIFVGYAVDYIKSKNFTDKKLAAIIVICILFACYPLIAQVDRTFGIITLVVFLIITVLLIDGIKKPLVYKDIPYKKYFAIFCIFLAIVSPTVCCAYQTSQNVVPGTNDEMWNSMTWIHDNEPSNVVIASWWDFGYLFEIASDRQSVFDGGMQGYEGRAYWLGKAMTTHDLQLSAGIFRMLGTSGYDPTNAVLSKYTHNNNGTSVEILDTILPQSKSDAKNTLTGQYKISSSDADKILTYTHPDNPRPVVFVASSDMLQKAGWWTYFGNWKFSNSSSEGYQYYPATNQTNVTPGHSGNLSMLNENGLNITAVITRGNQNNTTKAHIETRFTNNGSIAKVNGSDYNPLKASNLMVVENNYLVKNESIAGCEDGNYTLYLLGYNNTYTAVLMSNELVDSMFTKLYLLGGNGQNVFTQIHMENGVSLWQVNFNNTVAGGSSNSTSQATNVTSKGTGNNTTG